jgi:hypothetical protein
MTKFDRDDCVRVRHKIAYWFDVPGRRTSGPRIGEPASVYSITEDRSVHKRPKFPDGTLYGIEFDDGDAIEVHEDDLELIKRSDRG